MKLIKKTLKKWDLIVLILLITIYSATFSILSISRHNAFASNYDLANMSQTVWNTLHGRPFALSGAEGTISRFSIHADLILILISPLYLIWERAITLLVTQSFALGLGAIPAYFLARKVLKSKLASLSISLVYLLNPSMEWTNIYDFHGVALAIPFLLSAFYFAYVKKWKLFWLFVFLSLTTKEEMSLLVAALGLAIAFIFKERIIGITTSLVGVLWFIIVIFIIIPRFSPDNQSWAINSLYSAFWQKINNSNNIPQLWDVLKGYFLNSVAINYYIALLKPFAFVPILGLPWLLLSASEFAVNLLSTNGQMQSLTFHYESGITPFLVIATIFGIRYLLDLIKFLKPLNRFKKQILLVISIILVGVALRVNHHYSPLPSTPSCWCLSYQVRAEDIEFAKILAKIPRDASVTSSGEVRPHIARRENSFTLPGHVETADYVAILDENRIVGDYSPKEFENTLLKDPKFLKSHDLIRHLGHFYLFKRKDI